MRFVGVQRTLIHRSSLNTDDGHQKDVVNDCQSQKAASVERGLMRRLIKRVRNTAEREFVGGRYLKPVALRYDNQDISKYTVDRTCIFFCFPYFMVAKPGFRELFEKNDSRHPPRTLLQSQYRLNSTVDRDQEQCISLLRGGTVTTLINQSDNHRRRLWRRSGSKIEDLVYVPQLWGMIDGLGT